MPQATYQNRDYLLQERKKLMDELSALEGNQNAGTQSIWKTSPNPYSGYDPETLPRRDRLNQRLIQDKAELQGLMSGPDANTVWSVQDRIRELARSIAIREGNEAYWNEEQTRLAQAEKEGMGRRMEAEEYAARRPSYYVGPTGKALPSGYYQTQEGGYTNIGVTPGPMPIEAPMEREATRKARIEAAGKVAQPKSLPAERQQALSTLSELRNSLQDVKTQFSEMKNLVGPVRGRIADWYSSFWSSPKFTEFKNNIAKQISVIYGMSGAAVTDWEKKWLKEDVIPQVTQPTDNFEKTLQTYEDWLNSKINTWTQDYEAAGYGVGKASQKHVGVDYEFIHGRGIVPVRK